MADNRAGYGFRPARGRFAPSVVPERRKVASAYQAAPGAVNCDLNIGDPVSLVSDGTVALSGAGGGAGVYGVIVGIEIYHDGTKKIPCANKLPGGTSYSIADNTAYVLVVPVSGIEFEADCDDAATATTKAAYEAFIGENCDISYTGSSTTKRANPRIDISTHNTTNTLQFRITGIGETQENQDFSGAYVKLRGVFNVVQDVVGASATGV